MGQVSVARIYRNYNWEESIHVQALVARVTMIRENQRVCFQQTYSVVRKRILLVLVNENNYELHG